MSYSACFVLEKSSVNLYTVTIDNVEGGAPMPKKMWFLIIGMLVNNTGGSFLWPLNAIYIHDHLGKSLVIAGLALTLNSAAGVVGNLVGGFLFDKLGGYRAIMIGISCTIISVGCLTLWHGWPQYMWFLTLLGFSNGIVFPSMFAMAGAAWPEGGRRAFNAVFLAQNVGVAVGPALAGIVASYSFEYLFIINLTMFVIFFFIALTTYKNIGVDHVADTPRSVLSESQPIKYKSPFYALLIVSSAMMLVWVAYSQWSATISSYTQDLGLTLREYSLLWTINGLLIVLGQPLIAPLVRRWEGKSKRQLIFGICMVLVSFIVVGFAENLAMFATAMVILTFGEMFFWPVVPMIANQLAPKGRQGFYQGIVNSASTMGRMIGPLLGGILVESYGFTLMVGVMVGCLALAVVPSLLYDLPLKKQSVAK